MLNHEEAVHVNATSPVLNAYEKIEGFHEDF